MFELKFENEKGEVITLSGAEDRYQIIAIEGLNPPNAYIHRSVIAGMDGSKYMSAKLEERNIVLTVRINGDVERNRLNLYNYFRTKHYSKMYYKNGQMDVYIEGYVETVECNLFDIMEQMQVSIVCPNPYFQSTEEIVTDVSQVLGAFEFPFAFGADGVETSATTDEAIEFSTYVQDRITTVINEGEDETGVIIEITAGEEVVNPIIYNADTGEYFGLNITMTKGDVLTINTNRGEKSVMLMHEATLTNQINKLTRGSTWFTLTKGDNLFTHDADSGNANMQIVFTHRTRFQAV